MAGLINLPGYNPGNALNFSGINDAIGSVQQNALAQRQMGMQEQRLDMEKQRFGREEQTALAQRVGGLAQMGMNEKDPARRQAVLDRIIAMHPDKTKLGPEYLSPDTAFPMLMQEAQGFRGIDQQAQTGLVQAQTRKADAEAIKAQREAADGGKASLVPVWGKDAQGNDILLQTRPDGSAVQTRLPPGVSVTGRTSKIDLGTHWGITDQAGNIVQSYRKDVAGEAAQRAQGTEQGKAQVDLPKVKQNAATTLRYIDAIINDRNLGNVTGWQGYLPTVRSASRDTESRIGQLKGRAFLTAFDGLKGGGQITEIEGEKATNALARLQDMKQSDAGYKAALQDFRNEVMDLVRIAEQRARGGGPYVPPPGVPTDGVQRPNTDRLPPQGGWSIKRID